MLNRQYNKIQLSQKHYWENFKITDHKYWFSDLKIVVFLADIGYLVKLLSRHQVPLSPENLDNIRDFEGWGLILVAYKKISVCLMKLPGCKFGMSILIKVTRKNIRTTLTRNTTSMDILLVSSEAATGSVLNKMAFLEISQYSQKNTFAGASF